MVRKQAELYKSRAKLCSCVGVILPKTIGFAQDSVDCLLFCTVYSLLTLASEKSVNKRALSLAILLNLANVCALKIGLNNIVIRQIDDAQQAYCGGRRNGCCCRRGVCG
jgi:hypothetical protein